MVGALGPRPMMLPRIELGPRESESHVVTMLTIAPQKPQTAVPTLSGDEKGPIHTHRGGGGIKPPHPIGNQMGSWWSTPAPAPAYESVSTNGPYFPGAFTSGVQPLRSQNDPTPRKKSGLFSTRYGRRPKPVPIRIQRANSIYNSDINSNKMLPFNSTPDLPKVISDEQDAPPPENERFSSGGKRTKRTIRTKRTKTRRIKRT